MVPVMTSLGTCCPPPPRALPLLARAHILLHTRVDMCTSTEYGAIAACGIMIYGVPVWQLAQKNARSMLIDEEEGMVLVDYDDDFEDGRGGIREKDVAFVDEDSEDVGSAERVAAEEVRILVGKATSEIRKWDAEIGKRVGSVLRGLQVL
jgi:hypothetical protein